MRIMMIFLGLLALAVVSGCAYVRLSPVDAALTDPVSTPGMSSPNWALAAPAGVATGVPATIETPVFAATPLELLASFDAVARAQPRVEALPSDPSEPLLRGYVQRSALIGFPDVITVRAVDMSDGEGAPRAGLVVYSRSVYGYSDLGVNDERVRTWLASLEQAVSRAP